MIANALKRSDGNINYPGLIAAWSAKGKTNDDADKAILKDLTGNGHDITLNGFAFNESGSGYGEYTTKLSVWNKGDSGTFNIISPYKINILSCHIINKAILYTSNSNQSTMKNKKQKYKVQGLTDGQSVILGSDIGSISILTITTDGEYEVDWTKNNSYASCIMCGFIGECNITIEVVPNYPDALVFDGVDDYGVNNNMPILTDYTIIVKREIFGNKAYSCAISKYKGDKNGAFNFDLPNYNGLNSAFSYGRQNYVEFPKNKISWMTPLNYNQQIIKKGPNVDGTNLSIGVLRGNEYFLKLAFYSAYLFDRSLDEQEIKAFIRKYIDPEYLLPSEILTPDCYYDFSLGSNDDENKDTIKDLSGNGNDAVAHNFSWSGMSGYDGYPIDFKTEYAPALKLNRVSGTLTSSKITITSVINLNNFLESSSVKKHKSYKIKVTGVNDDLYIRYFYSATEYYNIKTEGIHVLPESDEVQFIGFRATKVSDSCNITIELIPEYPGALVFDGVDDYISLDAFDSGFKTMFIECSYVSLNTILYDQRKVGTEQEDCINTSAYEAGFYGRNRYGKTYINGVYNKPDSTLIASKLSNKHILITSAFKGDYTSTPCIASSNVNKGMYCNIALYKFLRFKEALTEEQIQTVIKKYNLLDGVDEIEVS